jgi:glycosyltransferase involved in cell wall biosynthesis
MRLLWVGQLIPRKRIDLAIASLARLRHLPWHFDVVGDGVSRSSLEQMVRETGLADRVTFHGYQPRPDGWYRQSDLLLFPSWLENSPVTMLEAMSHGIPCVAMKGDGVRYHNANVDIVTSGRDGFLAQSDEEFHAMVAQLLAAPERVTAAGESARATIAQRHTWTRHLERYESIFDELLDRRARTES